MDSPTRATLPPADAPRDPAPRPARRMSRRALRRRQPSRRNYWLHVLGGGSLIMALQFWQTPVSSCPGSATIWRSPISWSLVLPLYQAGAVAAQLLVTPQITRVVLRKHRVAGMGLALAGVFALIFAVAAGLAPAVAAIALLACALVAGVSVGVVTVSHTDLEANTVPRRVRRRNSGQAATLGGLLTPPSRSGCCCPARPTTT
jgi:MFS family permease